MKPTDEIERLRAENARLAREAHTWSKAAETYAADAERLRSLIADDASAMTYQTLGQYRTALLRFLRG